MDEFRVPRAYVQLTTTAAEDALANAMDAAILALAGQLAGNNPANLQDTGQDRDALGTKYHEAGTLWMGASPHVGSVNPTLTGLVLARKVAQAAIALATCAPPPRRAGPEHSTASALPSGLGDR